MPNVSPRRPPRLCGAPGCKRALAQNTRGRYCAAHRYEADRGQAAAHTPTEGMTVEGDKAEAFAITRSVIRNDQDLIAAAKIDTTTWEIERWVCNKWEMGAKDAKKYLDAFATIASGQFDPQAKDTNRVALTSEMVKDYDEQDIDLKIIPEQEADENAKAQRLGLYAKMYPQAYIDKYIEKAENQAELNQFRQEELLRANNPLWMQFETEETRIAVLDRDKEKAKRWLEFLEAQGLDEHGNPVEPEQPEQAPADPMGGQMPMGGMDPAMMDPMLNGGSMPVDPMAAQLDPLGVGAGMVAPAQMGMQTVSPEEAALRATFNGGG